MTIPEKIQTGFGILEPPTSSSAIDPESAVGKRLISMVFVMIQRAAKSAAVFTKHGQRTMVTPNDIRLALKHHAITFLDEDVFAELEAEVHAMHTFLENEVSSSMDDTLDTMLDTELVIDGDEDEEEETEEEEEQEEHHHPCTCSFCVSLMSSDFDAWNPTDPAEVYIKSAVEKTLNMV